MTNQRSPQCFFDESTRKSQIWSDKRTIFDCVEYAGGHVAHAKGIYGLHREIGSTQQLHHLVDPTVMNEHPSSLGECSGLGCALGNEYLA